MFVLGVDENGLGPLLGPLVTTAVLVEVKEYARARLLKAGQKLGVDDSKSTAGFGKMAEAESLALAIAERESGQVPTSAEDLLNLLGFESRALLEAPCPKTTHAQCWAEIVPIPCFDGDLARGRKILETLEKRGLSIRRVRSSQACTRKLNTELLRGTSRVELDLHMMERLILDARNAIDTELYAICGMVGGIRDYPTRMRHLPERGLSIEPQKRGELVYNVRDVGRVSFEIDADARHLPVALASMVGKYVRELWMERQNRFYVAQDATLKPVSGYHDPVTRKFIEASTLLRKKLGIDDSCFTRDSAKEQKNRDQLELFA